MPKPTLIALDTETGGLDACLNPILSIAIVVADETYTPMDGFEIKVAPPKNAVIEIPAPGNYFGKGNYSKRKIECYMNVWTKERTAGVPFGAPIINAIAAEVNGYVGDDALNWNFAALDNWNATSQMAAEAEADILSYLAKAFGGGHVVTVAHNASFDQRFVNTHMPTLYDKLKQPWFDTLAISRRYNAARGVKGQGKLTDMAKLAGFDYQGKAHQAFADGEATLAVLRFLQQQA